MKAILIINIHRYECDRLQNLLTQLGRQTYCEEQSDIIKNTIQDKAVAVIICLTKDEEPFPETMSTLLPSHIPVLLMHPQGRQLNIGSLPTVAPPVDILQPPLTLEMLRNKLDFLDTISEQWLNLEKISQENTILRQQIDNLHQSLEGHNSFLDLMSRRDGLTGLYNRRYFNSFFREEFDQSLKNHTDLAVMILNIDYFNEINRSCGQAFGDFVLNEFSARLTSNSNPEDSCFRFSGEDFVIVMPATPLTKAGKKGEELRSICQDKDFSNGHINRSITVSVGIASLYANAPSSSEQLIDMAEQALFLAKAEGRNRCCYYGTNNTIPLISTTDTNFRYLQETLMRVLEKTKSSTMQSLQLLAQNVWGGRADVQEQQSAELAELLSIHLHLPSSIKDTFRNAIILHASMHHLLHADIIRKNGPLSLNERDFLTDFPLKLTELTKLFDFFSNEQTILLHFGERYDGKGYPLGLKGEEIPMGARIFTVINAFAAMNSEKPYRPKMAPHHILKELVDNAGKQFDPFLVIKLIDIIEEKSILQVDGETLEKSRKTIIVNNPPLVSHVKNQHGVNLQ